MDENTVFNGVKPAGAVPPVDTPPVTLESLYGPTVSQQQPPLSTPVVPVAPLSSPVPTLVTPNPISPPPPSIPPSSFPPPPDSSHLSRLSALPLALIAKAGLGLLLVVLIILGIFKFVLPMFSGAKSGNVELTYWGLWEDPNVMNAVISDFERANPTIKVKYTKQDIKQYRERLMIRIKEGNGPDIFRFHNTWQPQLSSVLLPLSNDVMSVDEFKKGFYPVAQRDLIKSGALYGIPIEIDTLSLFINSDILSALGLSAPQTWEEFLTIACQATTKDQNGKIKTSGAALGTFDNVTHAPDLVSLLLVQNGANMTNLTSTSSNAIDALNFYSRFAQTSVCVDSNGKDVGPVWDETLDPSILAFTKGNLAMFFGYSWDILTIKVANPGLPFQTYSVPHLPGRNNTIASYWVEGISQKSKNQKEAMLFLKFLAQKETEQKLFTETSKTREFGEPYARMDLSASLSSNKMLSPFVEQAPSAVSSYFAADTYDEGMNTKLNGYLGNAVRSMLENTSADSALKTLSQGISQVFQQYGIQ